MLGPFETKVTSPRSRASAVEGLVGGTEPHADHTDVGRGKMQGAERCCQLATVNVHAHHPFDENEQQLALAG